MVSFRVKVRVTQGPCKRTQQVTTLLRVVGGFWPTMLSRLHGPKSLADFKVYATSANIVVVPCKRMQHVRPNNVACCWPTMLRPFAWAFIVFLSSGIFRDDPPKLVVCQTAQV